MYSHGERESYTSWCSAVATSVIESHLLELQNVIRILFLKLTCEEFFRTDDETDVAAADDLTVQSNLDGTRRCMRMQLPVPAEISYAKTADDDWTFRMLLNKARI